jgi:hypothetical protein
MRSLTLHFEPRSAAPKFRSKASVRSLFSPALGVSAAFHALKGLNFGIRFQEKPMNNSRPRGWIEDGRVFPERPAGYARQVYVPPDHSGAQIQDPAPVEQKDSSDE